MLDNRPIIDRILESELSDLAARDQLRSLEVPAGINLSSNDYLGLATHPALRQAVLNAVARAERMGATGSRLLSGHSREWEELEAEFAEFAGAEAALCFSSGYAANVGLLSGLLGRGDAVFSDALNHASLVDGIRLSGAERMIYAHCDLEALEVALRTHTGKSCRKLIVTESVFSMDGDFAPLSGITALAQHHGAAVVVDEAHALGVFGPEGRGRMAELGLEREAFAIVYPCGKALASAGGVVCGSATLKQFLINRARTFLFTTALPPYFAAQIGGALKLARAADAERARLAAMAAQLRTSLSDAGFDTGASASQIIPILLGENAVALHYAAELSRAGFAARAIRPPTVPTETARLRLSLTCTLSDGDVARLAQTLSSIRVHAAESLHANSASRS
jgi:8-amino-7-oxononanoate synthase